MNTEEDSLRGAEREKKVLAAQEGLDERDRDEGSAVFSFLSTRAAIIRYSMDGRERERAGVHTFSYLYLSV